MGVRQIEDDWLDCHMSEELAVTGMGIGPSTTKRATELPVRVS